ncbi:MAG TPA: hypothetical protein VFY25_13855 [Anaerolineales bacterium]|nr:hypothetical protein [Anaerolineales bacterium]
MPTTFSKLLCLLTAGMLALTACNMPGNIATEIATETREATEMVDLAATRTRSAGLTPSSTSTAAATETLTPEPSATFTPEPPKAEVVRETNCRIGPGGMYDLIAKYQVGQQLDVVAKDLGGGYWFIQNPEKPEEQCYLMAQNIKISGETTALPKFTPQPSPTAAPYFELSFKKFDICEGVNYALFTVENVGSASFRSVYIKVINQKADKSVEQAFNAFDLRVKCVLAKNIAPLDPGGTGYVYSPPFKWSGTGENLRAIIMACTEKNLKGSCITQTVDIKE